MTDAIEKQAKKMAVTQINKDRAEHSMPPMKQVTKLWWSMYKEEWIAKAKAENELAQRLYGKQPFVPNPNKQ